jgi:PAS domain S-box-containing protein
MSELSQNTMPMRVLILDEDSQNRCRIASVFQAYGIEPTTVLTLDDAINELRFGCHAVIVVNLSEDKDVHFSEVERILAQAPHAQIVLFSTQCTFANARKAIDKGAFACLLKSDKLDELLLTVYRAMHQFDARALHRSEMRFATIINDLSDMVLRYLPDGTITFANQIFLDCFELRPMDLNGRLIYEFVEASERCSLSALLEQFSPHNTVITTDVQMIMPQGRHNWYRWTNRAIFNDDKVQEIQSALHDITDAVYSERYLISRMAHSSAQLDQTHERLAHEIAEHQITQKRIRQREAELAHVARLNIMGEMASSIAHELNQPLAAIANYSRGCIKRLERIDTLPPAILQAMEATSRQAQRAGEIMRRLRDLVQRRDTMHELVQLRTVLAEVMEILESSLVNHGIKLQIDDELGEQYVQIDVIQIQQVFVNLIRNAIEAMKPVTPERNSIRLHIYFNASDKIQVDVIDQGCGLGATDPSDLFDMFVSNRSEGLGLGLSICRTIIETHGGQCEAHNRPEGGAVFSFTLPRVEALSHNTPSMHSIPPYVSGTSENI